MENFKMLDQETKIMRSMHTGKPVLQKLNTHYGYWAIQRFLSEGEYKELMGRESYTGPLHKAEVEYQKSLAFV